MAFDGNKRQYVTSAAIPNVTHTSGSADGVIDDVGASFNQAILNNNFKELSSLLNTILQVLRDSGRIST